ncbi:MAG: WS/DGAT/MGAT family O-acyltransferase [Panacagrimonas sp.]
MKPLTGLDKVFTLMEKRNQPLHVAYLNLLTPPPGAAADFAQKLVERLRSYASPLPPFNQRLESRLGSARWVDEPEFDIHQHVVHLALPRPGRMRDLLAMVSRMHANHLDRAYPLWRTYVIEGLEDGRIATYSKVHHAVADGIAGTRLTLRSMSMDPTEVLPPPWAVPPQGRRARPASLLTNPVGRAAGLAAGFRRAFGSVPAVVREIRNAGRERRAGNPDHLSGSEAPASILNCSISASRRYIARSYSLPRAKAASRALHCNVNDIVLAMCSHAVRRYLMELGALPDKPLIAGVPMSTRRDRSDSGNQLGFLLANLGTHLADPAARLGAITRSIEHGKQRYLKMKPGEILGYSVAMITPGMLNMMLNPAGGSLAFNVMISHVPGPRSQMHWMGCSVDAMYPVAVVVDGMALNISLTAIQDRLDFGILACRRSLPRIHHLLDYLEDGLVELEQLAAVSAQVLTQIEQEEPLAVAKERIGPKTGSGARRSTGKGAANGASHRPTNGAAVPQG